MVRKRLTHPAQRDPAWVGRRRAAMSFEEESEFLLPWAESAADGGMLIVAPLRTALAQTLGRAVTHPAVYRLLARHGWRKVAPDTRHPKSDPLTRVQWKKLPNLLATLLDPGEVRGRRVRLMFQDEARFGRMVRIRRCWEFRPHQELGAFLWCLLRMAALGRHLPNRAGKTSEDEVVVSPILSIVAATLH